jgi:hypothetical protein
MPAAAVTYSFTPATTIVAAQMNQNFDDVISWLNTNAIQKDATVAFTAVPSGPATDPASANQYARKQYVDTTVAQRVKGGVSSVATDVNGDVVVTHGLGATPVGVAVTTNSSSTVAQRQILQPVVTARTATTFTVRCYRSDTGAVLASQAVGFDWVASA